jgi:hypothetical protein
MSPPLPKDRFAPLHVRLDPRRPDYARILELHARAIARGEPGYRDPASGYQVFTAAQLWSIGACCDSGCRHCPFIDGAR